MEEEKKEPLHDQEMLTPREAAYQKDSILSTVFPDAIEPVLQEKQPSEAVAQT